MGNKEDKIRYIANEVGKRGVDLSGAQAAGFSEYFALLTEWAGRMNLTTVTDFEEVVERHFCDSLAITCKINITQTKNILDVGSGAGFPGIPLAIAFPETQVTLLDSLGKRTAFQEAVREKLQLKNLQIIQARAEDAAHNPELREQFDLVVSRAVANLRVLAEYCLPFAVVGGQFVAYKGNDVSRETFEAINAIRTLGGGEPEIRYYILNGESSDPDAPGQLARGRNEDESMRSNPSHEAPGDAESKAGMDSTDDVARKAPSDDTKQRSLVMIRKVAPTPDKYPRRAGIPAKRPL